MVKISIGNEYNEYVDITHSALGIRYDAITFVTIPRKLSVGNKGHSDDENKVCINRSDP